MKDVIIEKDKHYKIINKPGQSKEPTFWRYHDPSHPRHKRYHKRFPRILENIVGPKLLDIGCGAGLTCYLASQRDDIKEIVGIDVQESVLKDAVKNVKSKKVEFHQGFAEELTFLKESFNTVTLTETLEHVYNVDKTLKEAHRVLVPGGTIIITCPFKGQTSELHVRSIDKKYLIPKVEKYFKVVEFDIVDYPHDTGPKGVFLIGKK